MVAAKTEHGTPVEVPIHTALPQKQSVLQVTEVKGKASSEGSHEDACKRAVESACEQAPKGSACGLLGLPCEADAADPSLWRCSRKLGPRREEPTSIFGA